MSVEIQQNTLFSWFVILFAALGGMLYGYDLGIISGALLFISHDIAMTLPQKSFLVGAVLGGGAVATLISGILADWFGRKRMIIASAVIFLIGVFTTAFAHSYASAFIGRVTQGFGVGIITIIIPLYLAETLPANIRGRGICTFQLMLTAGILLANCIGLFFVPTHNWRGMFISASIPGFILLISSCFLPYSPRWLLTKGEVGKAYKSMAATHHPSWLAEEWDSFCASAHTEAQNIKNFFAALKGMQYLKPLLLVCLIAVLNQLIGINTILQFSAYLLKVAGAKTNISSLLGSNAIALTNLIITIIALMLIDKIGRRKLMCFGTIGAAISLTLIASAFFTMPVSQAKATLVLYSILSFIVCFAAGPGVCIWLLLSELLPGRIRSIGMSIALCANSFVSTALASSFLPLAQHFGYGSVFLLCAFASIIYFFVIYKFAPETMNQSLESIEQHFKAAEAT